MSLNETDISSLLRDLDWERVQVASAIPGRIRLKSSQLRGDEALGARVREALDAVDALTDVTVNPRTGSVLLHYNAERLDDLPTLIDRAAAVGMLPEGIDPEELKAMVQAHANGAAPRDFNREVRSVFDAMDASVKEATGGAIDLRGLVPLSLVSMGTYRLLSGAATQPLPWFNYFWFAFSIFVALEAGTSPDEPGVPDERAEASSTPAAGAAA
ncbi:MAG: HMA2 domain-containing protein [Salinibacter sp.]